MFSEKLKEETKSEHQSLEKIIIQHIKAIQSPADYKNLLAFFYGYYHPLEKLLDHFFNDNNIPQYTQRRKADSILNDIKQVTGQPVLSYDSCSELPLVQNRTAAWGALYVLEGSTLGGVHIAAMLSRQASIPGEQLTFFAGYGQKGITMWKAFIESMNEYVEENGGGDEIIASAKITFEKFEHYAANFYAMDERTVSSVTQPS